MLPTHALAVEKILITAFGTGMVFSFGVFVASWSA